jgi:hypothetical protein
MHPVASRIIVIQAHGYCRVGSGCWEFQPKTVLGLKIFLFARDLGDGLSRHGAALSKNESVSERLSGQHKCPGEQAERDGGSECP